MSAEINKSFLYWMYAGVNNSLAGNGGQECIASVPPLQRLAETVAFTALGLAEMYVAYPRLQLPSVESSSPSVLAASNRTGRNLLLAVMCLTFGIELGFKFATRQMIWILNPCHITTAIQVCVLVHFYFSIELVMVTLAR
jgi:TMEM164 family